MSLMSQTVPILIVVSLLIFNVVCERIYQLGNADVNRNWTRSQNQFTWNTTPWPALGQRRNSDSVLSQNGPTWVRPTQRTNIVPNNHRQPSLPSSNSNFNTGNYSGTPNKGDTDRTTPVEVSDDDLRQLSEALLGKDVNNAAAHVTINVQSKTTSRSEVDQAPLPLLSVSDEAFNGVSVKKMLALYDNYLVQSREREDYTTQEKGEESAFVDAIVDTPVMQHIRDFLRRNGKIGSDVSEFKNILHDIWFNMYARGGKKVGSSGFEHVFLAEIKNNQVSGLHNWLYFNEEEKKARANYLGYMKKIDLGNKGAILKYHFQFHGIDKPVGSMFIGTSPELEMALYTTCFLLRADKVCPMKLNGHRFVIRTFTYRYKGKNLIGSAFPEI